MVVPFHLYNIVAKADVCSQGNTVSLFHFRLNCFLLNLVDNDSLTLIAAYIATNLNVKADYLL